LIEIDQTGKERFRAKKCYGITMRDEASYVCDSCGEEIVIPVDYSAGEHQDFVEDCPVCCRPNVIHLTIDEDDVRVWAEPEQDYD
jgi:transposase-like protein